MSTIEVSGNPTTNNDTLVVNFTTNAPNIENISLSKDGGETYISATSFTNTSASFDVSDWSNGTYTNCMLRCVYTEEEIILYGISNILNNATSNNEITSISENSKYQARITANSGYKINEVNVTMGGTDITDSAVTIETGTSDINVSGDTLYIPGYVSGETLYISGYVSGDTLYISEASSTATYAVINIPHVTGDVIITTTTSMVTPEPDPEPTTALSKMTYGKGVDLSTGAIRDNAACWATIDPVTVVNGQTYTISLDASWVWVISYNEDNSFKTKLVQGNANIPQEFTFVSDSTKIRFGCYDPTHALTYCNLTTPNTV